ncbi:hypothetical protein HMPREF1553_00798 [Porphyromonas gingivalis F0568]|nr:hypothetical protein HMPREF1553_00798 [Porphyromonas gingivalis F0568]
MFLFRSLTEEEYTLISFSQKAIKLSAKYFELFGEIVITILQNSYNYPVK